MPKKWEKLEPVRILVNVKWENGKLVPIYRTLRVK